MTRGSLAILAFGTLLLSGCGCGGNETDRSDGRLQVVATTGQVADLVRNIGGDRVKVTSLMGPGIDPHLYKASAGDVERLRTADIIFYNGLHLEAKMGEVIERMGARRPTVAVAEAIPGDRLLSPSAYEGTHDPHVWFDVSSWRLTVAAVAARLAELDPDHADGYRVRAAAYAAELDALHAYALERFRSVPAQQRVLVTAHDAFNYLGRAYGLEVRGLQGISTATEAGTADVQDLAAFIAERRIPALFVESSVSPRAIEAVRQAVRSRGLEVIIGGEIYSDALGDPGTPAGTYLGMVRHNVDTITAALRGEASHEQH
ncbi:zinc ABC transporter substrate-binding protein [bacterium]|nr:zinc ABC transporter substrate-binding protein [bacterium]MBU1073736.1 zinc ABC transporter substrate-binding protein [bacterium]MBU1674634.1 zinc ABC transporter substrate-binding protein [bacterium]